MRLLLDQNLSRKLSVPLQDIFPGSVHVALLGLDQANDQVIWDFAKANDLAILTQDSDFYDLACVWGFPPKVIWLRCGNQKSAHVEFLLRNNLEEIKRFGEDQSTACLEIR